MTSADRQRQRRQSGGAVCGNRPLRCLLAQCTRLTMAPQT